MTALGFSIVVIAISALIAFLLPAKRTRKNEVPICPRVTNSDTELAKALRYLEYVPYEDEQF